MAGHAVNMASTTKPATAGRVGPGQRVSTRPTAAMQTGIVMVAAIALRTTALAIVTKIDTVVIACKRRSTKVKHTMPKPTKL